MAHTESRLTPAVAAILDSREEGHGLPQAFYHDPEIYARELSRIWYDGWLFAGFALAIPNPGDYLTLDVGASPVVVIRGDDQRIRAFHNVCRHRGTQICREPTGHVRAFVCPYHSWTYSRQGELMLCHGMHDGVDKATLGLRPLHVEVVTGLIYLSLATTPPAFAPMRAQFEAAGHPQGFERARIAKTIEYDVPANWKLVWENNRECYHCVGRHPQYVKSNFDIYEVDHAPDAIRQQIAAAVARTNAKWAVPDTGAAHPKGGLATFPDPELDLWYTCNRTALTDGFATESLDGKRVAPLMGDYKTDDVGVLRMRSLPNFWVHASCDHAVVTRMLPAGQRTTKMQSWWLVDKDAREGEDYEVDRLIPFWHMTNEQDWDICRWQQKGIDSIGYAPGPLSQRKEYNVDAFIRWYLQQMRSEGKAPAAIPLTRVA